MEHPFRELLRLAWPIAVSFVSYAVMTLVDTLFVGRLGPPALAGVGLGGVGAFALMCFAFGLLRGVKVHTSQAWGAGHRDDLGAYLGAGLILALVLGVVMTALGQLVAELLPVISAGSEAGAHARSYLRVRILGTPLVLVYVALREHRYGIGDSRTPMIAAVLGNVANIALDWLFIIRLDLGVPGAAWATVIGQGLEVVVVVLLARGDRLSVAGTRFRHVVAVWRVGIPTGIQFLLEMGAFSVLSVMIAALSDVQMAAHQIALQVIHFTFLPTVAVAEAASVMSGQAVGARREDLVLPVARRALVVVAGYAALCTVVLSVGARMIAELFTGEAELLTVTTRLLTVAAFFQVFDGAQVVAAAALRGTGDVRYPAFVGMIAAWLFTPPLTWLLGYQAGLGAMGGWIGLAVELAAMTLLLWWRLGRGGWRAAALAVRAERDTVEVVRVPAPAE